MERKDDVKIEDITLDVVSNRETSDEYRIDTGMSNVNFFSSNVEKEKITLYMRNDERVRQLTELLRNNSFAAVTIQNLDATPKNYLITGFDRSYSAGMSKISLNAILSGAIDQYLIYGDNVRFGVRYHELVVEDFDTDPVWSGTMTGSFSSKGIFYGDVEHQDVSWVYHTGTWTLSTTYSTMSEQSLVNSYAGLSTLTFGYYYWANYDFSCDVLMNSSTTLGIIFRYIDSNNYYRLQMDSTSVKFVKHVGGVDTVVASQTIYGVTQNWYTLRVIATSNRFEFFLDTDKLFDGTIIDYDGDIMAGLLGLYANGIDAYYDSIKVYRAYANSVAVPSGKVPTEDRLLTTTDSFVGSLSKVLVTKDTVDYNRGNGSDAVIWLDGDQTDGDVWINKADDDNPGVFVQQSGSISWVVDDEKGRCVEIINDNSYVTGSHVAGSYIKLNNDTSLANGFTIDVVFKITEFDGYSGLAFGVAGGWTRLLVNEDGYVMLQMNSTSGGNSYTLDDYVETDKWYRVTVIYTYDGDVRIFVDGKEANYSRTVHSFMRGQNPSTNTKDFMIGVGSSDTKYYHFIGRIKSYKVFDYANYAVAYGFYDGKSGVYVFDDNRFVDWPNFVDRSVTAQYTFVNEPNHSTTVYDASGWGYDGTMTNCTFSRETGRKEIHTAVVLNGSSSYIYCTNNNFYSLGYDTYDVPFTFEFLIKVNSTGTVQTIIARDNGTGTIRQWALKVETNLTLKFYAIDNSTGGMVTVHTSSHQLYDGKWTHVVVTSNGDTTSSDGVKFYFNGLKLTTSVTVTGSYTSMEHSTQDTYIGKTNGAEFLDGSIAFYRFYRRELTAEEVERQHRIVPHFFDFATAERVYDKHHVWKGRPMITNGRVLVAFPPYDLYSYAAGGSTLLPMVYFWINNSWQMIGLINIYEHYGRTGIAGDNLRGTKFIFEKLTPDEVTMSLSDERYDTFYDVAENYPRQMKIIFKNGLDGILINRPIRKDILGYNGIKFACYGDGMGPGYRYFYSVNTGDFFDSTIDSATQYNYNKENNWSMMWRDEERYDDGRDDFLFIIGSDKNRQMLHSGQHSSLVSYFSGTGYYSYSRYYNSDYYFVGFTEYQISEIVSELDEDETATHYYYFYTGTAPTVSTATTITGYRSNNYTKVACDTSGTSSTIVYSKALTLKKGLYDLRFTIGSNKSTSSYKFYFGLDDGGNNSRTYASWTNGYGSTDASTLTPSAFNTVSKSLYVYSDGTYYAKIQLDDTSTSDVGGEFYVDFVAVVPVANGVDYPYDVVDRAFGSKSVKRGFKNEQNVY